MPITLLARATRNVTGRARLAGEVGFVGARNEVEVTPEGLRMLAAVRPVVEALQADILAPLSPAEQARFLALAHKALGLR